MVFQPFLVIFLLNHWPIVYIVLYLVLLLLLLLFSFFLFGLFLLFHFFTRTSFISLFNHYAHLGKYVHIFIRTDHMRITTTVQLPVDSIGHKTGTRRDQVKNTRLPPQNSSGALAP